MCASFSGSSLKASVSVRAALLAGHAGDHHRRGGGAGIQAGSKQLIDCIAEDNYGNGLEGGELSGCKASNNGGNGMIGSSAINCTATANSGAGIEVTATADNYTVTGNQGNGITAEGVVSNSSAFNNLRWGIESESTVSDSLAQFNANGIKSDNLNVCIAEYNTGTGLEARYLAEHCRAEHNWEAGIRCTDATFCVASCNGIGILVNSVVSRCLIT